MPFYNLLWHIPAFSIVYIAHLINTISETTLGWSRFVGVSDMYVFLTCMCFWHICVSDVYVFLQVCVSDVYVFLTCMCFWRVRVSDVFVFLTCMCFWCVCVSDVYVFLTCMCFWRVCVSDVYVFLMSKLLVIYGTLKFMVSVGRINHKFHANKTKFFLVLPGRGVKICLFSSLDL